MKRLLTLLFTVPIYVLAQNKPLVVEGVAPNLYINHIVAPKENYYSIGRAYNISPKEVAPFNNLALENGLSLGQALKIPLSGGNFVQAGDAAADEVLIPIYHAVGEKESLYRIGVNYNKVPVDKIKQWNNLKGDAVSNGTNLIIGYLKVKRDLSSLAGMGGVKPVDQVAKMAEPPATTTTVAVADVPKPPAPKVELTVEKKPEKEKPVVEEKMKVEPVADIAKQPVPEKKIVSYAKGKNFSGGVFKSDYERQTLDKDLSGETGIGATFKSTSGWEDGKYYCLHNTTTPGTIVKITNTATGKSVYAKVLDVIPDISQNTGLLVRVSNAAANELGATDTKFDCTLSYSK